MKLTSFVLIGALGCAAHRHELAAERPQATGPEYDVALSHVLESATTRAHADALRTAFNLGYSTGQVEGYQVALKERGERMEQGCQSAALPVECSTLKNTQAADATMHGPAYAAGRLGVVERGVESGNSEALGAAFDHGYAASFEPLLRESNTPESVREQRQLGCLAAAHEANAPAEMCADR